jgi:arylsulfatase
METFKEYPPSQAPASFTVDPDSILKMLKMQLAQTGKD